MPTRHRALETKRIADGVDPLSDHQVCRVSERCRLKVGRVSDLQKRDIVRLIFAEHGRLVLLLIGERDLDQLRAFDDVIVRKDVALLVDDEARTLALFRHRLIEEVVCDLHRRDIHDRRYSALVDGNVLFLFRIERR